MLDIVSNPARRCIVPSWYFPYYLCVSDACSRFFVPMSLSSKATTVVFEALRKWAIWYGPDATFNISRIHEVHGDFDSVFKSAEFLTLCEQNHIKVTLAAPRHQEMNALHEANWRTVRAIAFALMNQAQVGMEWFPFALEQAWKIFSVLPHKALTEITGVVRCPLGVFLRDEDVRVGKFRVMFCPVVANLSDGIKYSKEDQQEKPVSLGKDDKYPLSDAAQQLLVTRQNESQRAFRGIHVGIPRIAAGFLVYNPRTNNVTVSQDVYFDENFESALAFRKGRFPGSFNIQVTTDLAAQDVEHNHFTGSPFPFCNDKVEGDTITQYFARPTVEELFDIPKDTEFEVKRIVKHKKKGGPRGKKDTSSRILVTVHWLGYDDPKEYTEERLESVAEHAKEALAIYARDHNLLGQQYWSEFEKFLPDESANATSTILATKPVPPFPPLSYFATRSQEEGGARSLMTIQELEHATSFEEENAILDREVQQIWDQQYDDDFVAHMVCVYNAETQMPQPTNTAEGMDPECFLPVPDRWQQILKLPPHIKKHWIAHRYARR